MIWYELVPAGFAVLMGLSQPQPAKQPDTSDSTSPAKQPAGEPGVVCAEPTGGPRNQEFATVDDLLAAIERADVGVRTLAARVKFDQVKGVDGDRRIRIGRVWYSDEPGKEGAARERRFAVRFEQVQIGARVDQEIEEIVFDGQWMVERKPGLKQIIKTQIARPGTAFDPLKLGEGQFPLPIGQKAAEIKAKYDAVMLTAGEALEAHEAGELPGLQEFVKETVHVKLTPLAALLPNADLKEIHLWYRRAPAAGGGATLVPRLARTVNRAGDVSIVQLVDVVLNEPVPAEVMDTRVPEGWDAQVRELPPAAAGPAPTGR